MLFKWCINAKTLVFISPYILLLRVWHPVRPLDSCDQWQTSYIAFDKQRMVVTRLTLYVSSAKPAAWREESRDHCSAAETVSAQTHSKYLNEVTCNTVLVSMDSAPCCNHLLLLRLAPSILVLAHLKETGQMVPIVLTIAPPPWQTRQASPDC